MNRFSTSMSDIGHRVRLPVGHRGTPGGTVDILVPWSPAQKVPMASPNCSYNRNLLPVAPTSPRGEVAALEMSLYHSPRSTTLEIVPPIFWGVLGLNVGLPGFCCRGVGQEERECRQPANTAGAPDFSLLPTYTQATLDSCPVGPSCHVMSHSQQLSEQVLSLENLLTFLGLCTVFLQVPFLGNFPTFISLQAF